MFYIKVDGPDAWFSLNEARMLYAVESLRSKRKIVLFKRRAYPLLTDDAKLNSRPPIYIHVNLSHKSGEPFFNRLKVKSKEEYPTIIPSRNDGDSVFHALWGGLQKIDGTLQYFCPKPNAFITRAIRWLERNPDAINQIHPDTFNDYYDEFHRFIIDSYNQENIPQKGDPAWSRFRRFSKTQKECNLHPDQILAESESPS